MAAATSVPEKSKSTQLDVLVLEGFRPGYSGEVVLNFTCDPAPKKVYWKLNDSRELYIEPPSRTLKRFNTSKIHIDNSTICEARLRFSFVHPLDLGRLFRLVIVADSPTRKEESREFVFTLSSNNTSIDVGSGKTAGTILLGSAAIIWVSVAVYVMNPFAKRSRRGTFQLL